MEQSQLQRKIMWKDKNKKIKRKTKKWKGVSLIPTPNIKVWTKEGQKWGAQISFIFFTRMRSE